MRSLLLLALLAAGFGLAAWWQDRHVEALRKERAVTEAEVSGEIARTPSGALEPGAAVLWIGRPSGAEPFPRPVGYAAPEPEVPAAPPRPAPPPPRTEPEAALTRTLGAYSLEVQPGQTLSGIAHLHYGRADAALVNALAAHNDLDDPDQLRVGHSLELPPLESLAARR